MKSFLSAIMLAAALALVPCSARAQAPGDAPPAGEEEASSGDPLYGYIGTAFFAALAVFAVCKSSRR
jgi:hypothetical protein